MANRKVLVIGSARESSGGVSSAIRQIERLPVWKEYSCRWIGTQIQRNYLWKIWYAVKSWFTAFFVIWKYDIVHFHTVPDLICLVIQFPVFLIALSWRKKIVMHVHMGNQLAHHTANRLFLWHLRRADTVILLAKKWQRLFAESFPSIHTPATYLYNICDIPASVTHVKRDRRIIMVGYMDDNKAPDILLRAWKMICRRYPDWNIYMLGNGDVERFRKMSIEMNLQDSVHFTGYITGAEKHSLTNTAAIHVLCSYEEGFPMVVLEAWGNGTPVITTPVGGLPDVIEEGKNCITFPFGNAEALAEKISYLIEHEDVREYMSEYEQKFVRKYFAPELIDEKLRSIYERL